MKIFRPIFMVFLIFSLVFTIFVGKGKISQNKITENASNYKGILSLWHIDGFEGGSGSRRQFLMWVSRQFEKQNQDVLVMVSNHTNESAKELMNSGVYPDMISYSVGIDLQKTTELSNSKSPFSIGGKVGNKNFSLCWCRGGYVLISNPNLVEKKDSYDKIENVVISQGEYTQPLLALILDNISIKNYKILPPLDAYIKFTEGKTSYFVGTQRDIVRLENRGFEYTAYPLKNFNDLYQYISICASEEEKIATCNAFIEFLTSKSIQENLNKISMMSYVYQSKLENQNLIEMQKIKSNNTLSAFTSNALVGQIQSLSKRYIDGDEKVLPNLKNILYKS